MARPSEGEWDVIVLGAGLSGLTAAYHLTKTDSDCKVLVLEAKDRVGGRTLTKSFKAANGSDFWDLGGQWVCRTQHHALWLLKDLGIEQYEQFVTGTKLQQSGGSSTVKKYEGDIPALPVHVLLDLLNLERKGDGFAKQFPYDEPWNAPNGEQLDSMTFEEFMCKSTWTKGLREVTNMAFETVLGARGKSYSALFYLFYISSGISNKSLYDNKNGGAQESKIEGGAQTMSNQLADKIGNTNIVLSEPVAVIDQSDDKGKVKVQTLSGKSYYCKYVINSVPLNCEATIRYLPDPPVKRQVLIGHTHVGHLMKFIVTYSKTFWRDKGCSGEIVNTCHQSPTSKDYTGPIMYAADATTNKRNPAIVGFINNPMYWTQARPEERKEAILNHLAVFFGPEAKSPIDYDDKDWAREPYNGGCPTNMMVPGAAQYWDAIREPFNRVHYAGTETATQWMGYLSGAVQAGMRAADEVTARLNGRDPTTRSDLLKGLDDLGDKDRKGSSGVTKVLGKFTPGI